MKLLVVESTGKATRILDLLRKASLSDEWEVVSCEGHYAGLSPKSLSLDPKKDFAPSWKSRNKRMFARVKSAVDGADEVYAGTDSGPDGEVIALQVSITAENAGKPFRRVRIPSLTVQELPSALQEHAELDQNLIGGYLAREAIDRFVRFKLGSVLGKKLGAPSLERISSLLLTELARRERRVRRFTPSEHWTVRALLDNGAIATSGPLTEEDASEVVRRCKAAEPGFHSALQKVKPPEPFNTSTLLQFLNSRYGYTPEHVMNMASTLYSLGFITYPYTSSTSLDVEFVSELRKYIHSTFGEDFLEEDPASCSPLSGLGAIRPLDISVAPSKAKLRGDLKTVYQAIWFNSLATQGTSALLEEQECRYQFFGETEVCFTARGTRLASPGWHQLSGRLFLDQEQELREEGLAVLEASAAPTKTTPPERHSPATLIAWMDDQAVGRPHNYAHAFAYMIEAEYAAMARGRLQVTPKGEALVTYLRKAAPDLIDPDFHGEAEEEIESVLSGNVTYASFASDYWEWATEVEAKMKKSSLRPRFKSPGGKKTKVWVGAENVFAVAPSEDWSVPILFDEKGRICPAEGVQ